MKSFFKIFTLLLTVNLFCACSNDDDSNPPPVNEEEVITTLIVSFVPQGGGATIELKSQDLDGDGPDAPIITISGSFSSNTIYNGDVEFLNELVSPPDDITEEVSEESLEHQVFFNLSGGLGTVSYNDMDADGNPIGLDISFQTEDATSITELMTVTLIHEPNKEADGVSDGNIANAGGETDIEVTFSPITVE